MVIGGALQLIARRVVADFLRRQYPSRGVRNSLHRDGNTMSCPGYQPIFGTGQLDGTRYEGVNCTCWSAGKAADDDSCGARKPSASQVRVWTRDTSGGTTLAQIDLALRENTNTDLDTRYRYPWADFMRRVNGGASAILQGWYAPIRASRFRGSETFGGNHAMLVTRGLVTMDPLADGRRPGIYKYHGESYPESLLKDFAARLNIGGSSYRPLGQGLVYAAFTRDNEPNYRATVGNGKPGYPFFVYTVTNGVITGRVTKTTGGFSATCTAPRLYRWPAESRSISLVQLTSGYRKGQYISSKLAHPA